MGGVGWCWGLGIARRLLSFFFLLSFVTYILPSSPIVSLATHFPLSLFIIRSSSTSGESSHPILVGSPWGEHEIDYVLFATVRSRSCITLDPHPEEVDDVKWVTKSELSDMFRDESLLFSPWFRIIADRWLMVGGGGDGGGGGGEGWWDDLRRTMTTDDFCDYGSVHRFDPPAEHMGGDGDAGPMFKPAGREEVEKGGEEKKSEDDADGGRKEARGAGVSAGDSL